MLLVICSILLFFPIYVSAATITETSYKNGRITIKGTGEGELQLVLFGLDNNPLYLTTVTAEDGEFSITLPEIVGLEPGTYTIKVADYDGKNVSIKTVEVKLNKRSINFR